MIKLMLIRLLITASLYTFIYLCRSFIIFELTNPFQWIIEMPKYDYETRFLILFWVVFYYVMLFFATRSHFNKKD